MSSINPSVLSYLQINFEISCTGWKDVEGLGPGSGLFGF